MVNLMALFYNIYFLWAMIDALFIGLIILIFLISKVGWSLFLTLLKARLKNLLLLFVFKGDKTVALIPQKARFGSAVETVLGTYIVDPRGVYDLVGYRVATAVVDNAICIDPNHANFLSMLNDIGIKDRVEYEKIMNFNPETGQTSYKDGDRNMTVYINDEKEKLRYNIYKRILSKLTIDWSVVKDWIDTVGSPIVFSGIVEKAIQIGRFMEEKYIIKYIMLAVVIMSFFLGIVIAVKGLGLM